MRRLSLASRATGEAAHDWQATEPWVRTGFRVVVYFLGGLLAFMALVSISGAVIATGSVTVEGDYKTVQHLDGGIVSKILVRNGDRVQAGDVLVKIDDSQARASLAVTRQRVSEFAIQKARLEAERDKRESFMLPADLDAGDVETQRILSAQTALFNARRATELGQQAVLSQRLGQLEDETRGLQSQRKATLRQRDISANELATVMPLYEKGFVNQQRIAPLQRESARLDGEIGRLDAELAKVQNAIGETRLRIAQSDKEYMSAVTDELRKVEAQLAEQTQTLMATSDRAGRTDVTAPVSGYIHALAVHTEGGVITAASPILQIIPENAKLVVEAELAPQSIDKVQSGQSATVRFPAFNSHTTPRLTGTVLKVSPAEIADQQGRKHFTAQIGIAPEELAKIGRAHVLVPGMPAEVFIETRARSILSYLLKPLDDMVSRAFRES